MDILLFDISDRRYALPLPDVREIVRSVSIAPLPSAPAAAEGVINFRGVLVPVLDARKRFGLERKDLHPDEHMVIGSAGERLVALRADRVVGLLSIDPADVVDATTVVPGACHVTSIARLPDGLVLIHDLRTFLTQSEAAALDAALGVGAGQDPS